MEGLIEYAALNLSQPCVVVSLLPWRGATPPGGVLLPRTEDGLLDTDEIAKATAPQHIVLVPCMLATADEELAASRIMPQLVSDDKTCVIMVQVLPPGMEPCREWNDLIMSRHKAMLAFGADDVILNPSMASLSAAVDMCHATWTLNMERIHAVLEMEGNVTADEVKASEHDYSRLLWECIPRALMPHFSPVNVNAIETAHTVQKYRVASHIDTIKGTVLTAVDELNTPYVVKVTDKSTNQAPSDVECVYRERRLLSHILSHPNIARCLDMVHTRARVYLVFDFVGQENLRHTLSSLPGERLDEDIALDCFGQIARAVSYCHSLHIAHRSLSLEHIVVSHTGHHERYNCVLVDFNAALAAHGDTVSYTICGRLPCIAPEVARSVPYVPRLADCWSTGIVVVEMVGGLSSTERSVRFDPDAPMAQAAASIQEFFSHPGSHECALAYMGGVKHPRVISILQRLLRPAPIRRSEMRDVLQMLSDLEAQTGH